MKNEQIVEQTQQDMNELIKIRFDKLDAIRAQGREPFGKRFDFTHHTAEIIRDFNEEEEKEVRIAGRLMAIRGHGKASFGHIMDAEGKSQVYFRQDRHRIPHASRRDQRQSNGVRASLEIASSAPGKMARTQRR